MPPRARAGAFGEADRQYERALAGRFLDVRATLECEKEVRVRTSVREGDTASELLQAASEMKADLLVVGMHAATALERVLAGSLHDTLLRRAGCSVLVVPRWAEDVAGSEVAREWAGR